MGTLHTTSEIVELGEELDSNSNFLKSGKKFSIQDDINRLFESIDIRVSARNLDSSQGLRDNLRKKSVKRPMRFGLSQASEIGISESISLKQALRGLCISQASEMAAMKRLSKPLGLPGVLEAGTIKRLNGAVVVEANKTVQLFNAGKVEISLVPEKCTSNLPEKIPKSLHVSNLETSIISEDAPTQQAKMTKTLQQAKTVSLGSKTSKMELGPSQNLKLKLSSLSTHCKKKLPLLDEIVPASVEEFFESVRQDKEQKPKLHSDSSRSISSTGNKVIQSASTGPKLMKPLFRNKNLVKKKNKPDSISVTSGLHQFNKGADNDFGPTTSEMDCRTADLDLKKASPASTSTCVSIDDSLSSMDSGASKPGLITDCSKRFKTVVTKADDRSRSREKGEFSQSSNISICEYSSSTSFSDESNLSGSGRIGCRPHMSKDLRWEAVRNVQKQHGSFGLRHFKLLRKLGGGDIGTVYLAELMGSNCLYALKVMDYEFLAQRKKMTRAQTEWEILQLLDHPFLPTLFAQFTTDKYSCFVMEYCPGGDLHVLRQKQPNKNFSEQAARFYVGEVLLALEYLHMLGIVYRDLKPENILVREDGHIMLTDFDLSLRCSPNPTLVKPQSPVVEHPKRVSNPCSESSCMDPFCPQASCFTPKLLSKTRKLKSDLVAQVSPLPQLVVEPTSARSNSFVGTHEYLAPEIIKGEGHGSPVDWWTFGILLYELLYGRTPFKGTGNEDTLANVVSQTLSFPESAVGSSHSRDLIRRLLRKQPENRLGSLKGAAEIKQHPFFEGLNWALIRCASPPELPSVCDIRSITQDMSTSRKCEKECSTGEHLIV